MFRASPQANGTWLVRVADLAAFEGLMGTKVGWQPAGPGLVMMAPLAFPKLQARAEVEIAGFPRGKGHSEGCACEVCRRLREARPAEEKPVIYGLKVAPGLKARLQAIGADRVRAALEALAKEDR